MINISIYNITILVELIIFALIIAGISFYLVRKNKKKTTEYSSLIDTKYKEYLESLQKVLLVRNEDIDATIEKLDTLDEEIQRPFLEYEQYLRTSYERLKNFIFEEEGKKDKRNYSYEPFVNDLIDIENQTYKILNSFSAFGEKYSEIKIELDGLRDTVIKQTYALGQEIEVNELSLKEQINALKEEKQKILDSMNQAQNTEEVNLLKEEINTLKEENQKLVDLSNQIKIVEREYNEHDLINLSEEKLGVITELNNIISMKITPEDIQSKINEIDSEIVNLKDRIKSSKDENIVSECEVKISILEQKAIFWSNKMIYDELINQMK